MQYDVIVIGSGAGLAFVNAALAKGLKCAIVEKDKFGGTCLTKGCIPSKILIQPADILKEIQRARKIGVLTEHVTLDWNTVSKRMWKKIAYSYEMEEHHQLRKGLDVFKGTAEFVDKHTLKIKTELGVEKNIKADKIILGVGARSKVPPIPGLKSSGYITSEKFYGHSFPKKPWKDLIIIGGGVIGVEFAHMLSAFGTDITMIELGNRLLPREDLEVSRKLLDVFQKENIHVYLEKQIQKVYIKDNRKIVQYLNADSNEIQEIEAEEILVATGLVPNTDIVKTEHAGLKLDRLGYCITNEFLETSVDNIWALGDVNGLYQFRHNANYEMSIVTNNLLNPEKPKRAANYKIVPWGIFTNPQIAHLGMTQTEALNQYDRVLVAKMSFSQVAKGYALGYDLDKTEDGFVKLIFSPEMRMLGAHIIGEHATILIQPYVVLMSSGCIFSIRGYEENIPKEFDSKKEYVFSPLNDMMLIHPSLSEVTGWAYRMLKWVER